MSCQGKFVYLSQATYLGSTFHADNHGGLCSEEDYLPGLSGVLSSLRIKSPVSGENVDKHSPDKSLGAQNGSSTTGIHPAAAGAESGLRGRLLEEFILESLSFKSMSYREQDITHAHGTSFEWIFSEQRGDGAERLSFSKWISTEDLGNIYWSESKESRYSHVMLRPLLTHYSVTGKPGSGKSTLMRYLSGHEHTKRSLQRWAGSSQLVVAGFYFWTSGSEEQRSQTGLLRSLLHQLLSSDRSLVAAIFPQQWKRLASMSTKERIATSFEWTASELIDGFRLFLDHGLQDTKICLFVDGLDEFDGDHETIIHLFRDVAEGQHGSRIKLCLSSRPWAVFERAFEYTVPNLKLQASTFQDMFRYTVDRLSDNDNVRNAMAEEADLARELVQTTVERAGGVFLWVRLAVRELVRHFDHDGARAADMRDHVCALPTELDDLFEVLVFRNQPERGLSQTSRLFQLVRAREVVADFIKDEPATSLSLWELAFAVEGSQDDELALERAVEQEAGARVAQRCMEIRDWTLDCSVGLLDVYYRRERGNNPARTRFSEDKNDGPDPGELVQHRVTYLHRTVRDWLVYSRGDRVWSRLEAAGRPDASGAGLDSFDPHIRLLRSYVLQMKHPMEEPEHHRRLDEWYPGVALALSHARYVTRDPLQLQTKLVDELDKTISWYWLSRGSGLTDHWARNCFGTYEERRGRQLSIPHPFLALCTKFGLERYVLDSLDAMAAENQPFSSEGSQPADSRDNARDDGDDDARKQKLEETPLLHRALEFLCSRQKTIYPTSSLSLVQGLLRYSRKYSSSPYLSPLIGSLNEPFTSVILKRKEVTPWIMVLRHIRDAKRRGWIELFDVDQDGTDRWTSIVKCLVLEGGADRNAVVKGDGWDPEIDAKGVLGHGGILDDFADFWVEERLTPLFKRE